MTTNSNSKKERKETEFLCKVRYTNMRIPKRNQEINLALQNEIVQNVRTWEDMGGLLFKILLRAGFSVYFDQPTAVARPTNSPVITKPPIRR